MKKFKLLALICMTIVALMAAGCSNNTNDEPAANGGNETPDATADKEPVEINFWQSGSEEDDAQAKFIQAFNESHPGIKVVPRYIPFANYDDTLNTAFTTKSGPDIATINSVTFGTFASRGYLKDIGTTIANAPGLEKDKFFSSMWDSAMWKGKMEGIPVDTGTRALLWNKTLFEKAGVKPFGEEVTWDEMKDAAAKISALGGDIHGWGYSGAQNWLFLYNGFGPMVHQAGGDFLTADLSKATLTSPEVIEAVKFYADLANYAPKSDVVNKDNATYDELFANDKTGMIYAGFWEISDIMKANPDVKFGISLPKQKQINSSTGGWILSVPSYVPDEKMEAIKTFYQEIFKLDNLTKFTGLMPSIKEARKAVLTEPMYELFWKVLDESSSHPIALNPSLSQQSTILMEEVQSVIQGEKTPEEAMESAQKQFDDLLAQNP